MKNYRLEMKKERLRNYYEAEERILKGQSYALGTMRLTRADLSAVQKEIKELEAEVGTLEQHGTTKRRCARVLPFD